MRNAKEQKNNKMNKCEMRMMTTSQPIRTSYHNKKNEDENENQNKKREK